MLAGSAVVPRLLMTWAPDYVPPTDAPGRPGWAPCNKATPAGARAVVYEHASRGGRGIVAVCDFGSATGVPHPTFRYAGWSQLTLLEDPVPRERLLADPILASVFGMLKGPPRRLSEDQGRALCALIGDVPEFKFPRAPTARERRTVMRDPWRPGGGDGGWVTEAEIENAIAAHGSAWRKLGFVSAPRTQVAINPRDRPDLLGEDVVGEIKLKATASDVAQLQRYTGWLDSHKPLRDSRWRGLLITGAAHAHPALLGAVERADHPIELWSVTRRRGVLGPRVNQLALHAAMTRLAGRRRS
jgi:hypothetical protein